MIKKSCYIAGVITVIFFMSFYIALAQTEISQRTSPDIVTESTQTSGPSETGKAIETSSEQHAQTSEVAQSAKSVYVSAVDKIDKDNIIYKRKIEEEKIGLIEAVEKDIVTINLGRDAYVSPSMEFKVFRREGRIELPDTAEVVGVKEYYVGKLKVVEVKPNQSKCIIIHTDPSDELMINDKVVNIPRTGYEELIRQREIDAQAQQIFLRAKSTSRFGKFSAIEYYEKVINDFPNSKFAQLATEEIQRYPRIDKNSPYLIKNTLGLTTQRSSSSSNSKDIAVDSQGGLWLLNTKKSQIEKYDQAGQLQLIVEKKEMKSPISITTDTEDNIYVLDATLKKVNKFDSNGKSKKGYGFIDAKKQSQLEKPVDLAVNSNGDVFILDAGSCQVYAFTNDNRFWVSFGREGTGPAKFIEPVAIDIDDEDRIYVLDQLTKNVHVFGKDFRYRKKFKIRGSQELQDMAVFLNKLYVLDREKGKVFVQNIFKKKGKDKFGQLGTGHGKFSDATGIAVDNQGIVYIADGKNYSIQKFTSKGKFLGKLKDEQISKAVSLAVNNKDNVYILDNKNRVFQELDMQGWALNSTELKAKKSSPVVITVDFHENIYVLDNKNCKIQKFSPEGELLFSFGSKKQFRSAVDICVDKKENIYVLDTKGYTVEQFDNKGKHIKSIGERLRRRKGETFGQFKKPINITIDSKANLYVLDEKTKEIYKFDSESGDLILSFQKDKRGFRKPNDMTVDGLGNIYVSDSDNVFKFKDDGTQICQIISQNAKREVNPRNIAAISVNGAGSVFVLDDSSNKILRFSQ